MTWITELRSSRKKSKPKLSKRSRVFKIKYKRELTALVKRDKFWVIAAKKRRKSAKIFFVVMVCQANFRARLIDLKEIYKLKSQDSH